MDKHQSQRLRKHAFWLARIAERKRHLMKQYMVLNIHFMWQRWSRTRECNVTLSLRVCCHLGRTNEPRASKWPIGWAAYDLSQTDWKNTQKRPPNGGHLRSILDIWCSQYSGGRVTHYYETRDGKSKQVQMQKARWYNVLGRVEPFFDEILVLRSQSLPKRYTNALEPWDISAMEAYQPQYLAGLCDGGHHLELENAFKEARVRID